MSTLDQVLSGNNAEKSSKNSLVTRSGRDLSLVLFFSVLYFSDVLLRASEKYFWYDELFTVYFSRLRSATQLWGALNSGIDFNPPFFYWLTRLSNALLGEGLVATRLPEILAFWVFSVCLFLFVSRRSGSLAGFGAMLFPMATGAYFYAYEARPHALVLGFCGLALVAWQIATESIRVRGVWLIAFSASLFGAFMMHCYALALLFPFATIELFRTFRRKHLDWKTWISLIVPAALACCLYVPLLRSYRKLANPTTFSAVAPAGWTQIAHFYRFLFTPCILVVVAALAIFAVASIQNGRAPFRQDKEMSPAFLENLLLGAAFLLVPAFGVAVGKTIHAPFFHRYFLSTVAGFCLLAGLAAEQRARRSWIPLALALVILSAVGLSFSMLVIDRAHGRGEWLMEPSSQVALDTTPGQPLYLHRLLHEHPTALPIAVLSGFDFIYLVHYAPALKRQLYYVAPSTSDFAYVGFERLLQCCDIRYNTPSTDNDFVRAHTDFLVYGNPTDFNQIARLNTLGARMKSVSVNEGHFLAEVDASGS